LAIPYPDPEPAPAELPSPPIPWQRVLASSLAKNLSAVMAGRAVTILAGLVTLGYAARTLGPAAYGMCAFATAAAAYASILLSPGLTTWGTRTIAQDRSKAGQTLLVVNLLQLALAVVAYAALAGFTVLAISDPTQRVILLLAGLILFTTALGVEWVFAGLELMRINALVGAGIAVATAVALLSLVRSPAEVYYYAAFPAAFGLLAFLAGWGLLYRYRIRLEWPSLATLGAAVVDSLPLGLTMALVTIWLHANHLIVRGFLGTEALGVFAAAFRLVALSWMVPVMLASVFMPRLARVVKERRHRAAQEVRTFVRVHLVIAIPIAATMAAEAPALVALVFGPQYTTAVPLVRVLAVAVVFSFAKASYEHSLIAFSEDRALFRVVAVSCVVAVGGGLVLVPWLGTIGAAAAVAAMHVAGWIAALPALRRITGSFDAGGWVLPLAGAGLAIALSLVLQAAGVPFWIRVAACGAVYLAAVWRYVRSTVSAAAESLTP